MFSEVRHVRSTHLDIKFVCKSLVFTVVVSVWVKLKHTFSMDLSLALKCLFPVRNAFASSTKNVHLYQNKCVRLLFGTWFRNSQKEQKLEEDMFLRIFISSRDGHEKVQKQGRANQKT